MPKFAQKEPKFALKAMLNKKKWSARKLARELKKDYPNTLRLLRPGANPEFNTMVDCARVLGCKVKDLIHE